MARFRPGRVATIATAFAVGLLCSLGTWQVRRLQWRNADIAAKNAEIDRPVAPLADVLADPAGHAWRRTTARGTFDHAQSVLVFPVTFERDDGGRILTPLRVEGGGPDAPALLVDRGFVPTARIEEALASEREALASEREVRARAGTAGVVEVTGVVKPLSAPGVPPGSATARRDHWIRFDPRKPEHTAPLQAQLPYPLGAILIQAEDDGSGGLPRGAVERPRSPVDHLSYAITWYGAAVAVLATWVEYGRQRGRGEIS